MKKIISLLSAAAIAACGFIGCTKPEGEQKTFHVYMPDGAPAVALGKFMSEGYDGAEFTVVPNAAKVTIAQHVAKGDADMAILPINAAATLYNSGVDIVMASVNTHGNLYVIGEGDEITLSDLVGKKLGVIGQANVPEHALKMLLEKYEINYAEHETPTAEENKVSITYVGNGAQLGPQLNGGLIDYGFLAEPAATTLCTNLKKNIVLDVQAAWKEAFGGEFPQACLVVKKSLTKSNAKYVDRFIAALYGADGWAEEHPSEVVEAVSTHMEDGTATTLTTLTADTVKRCNIKTVPAVNAKSSCETYFNMLIEMSTALGAPISKVPDDGFYYNPVDGLD
ncbi:MAG: ABC transporter substrate-binding protein [Clostridiales bacterium]|nr:ABC transporter substrate-binding protein [Clostridiales bacterium]